MGDRASTNSFGLRVAALALIGIAIGALAFGVREYQAAMDLSAQLAATTKDAKEAHEEASSLKAQLGSAEIQATNELQQLAEAQQQVSAEQQRFQNTQAQLAAESRPDLPVILSFRPALLGQGKVAVLQNTSDAAVEVDVNVSSAATGMHKRFHGVINGRGNVQIGRQQGWQFAPGQVVTIVNGRYRPIVRTVT